MTDRTPVIETEFNINPFSDEAVASTEVDNPNLTASDSNIGMIAREVLGVFVRLTLQKTRSVSLTRQNQTRSNQGRKVLAMGHNIYCTLHSRHKVHIPGPRCQPRQFKAAGRF